MVKVLNQLPFKEAPPELSPLKGITQNPLFRGAALALVILVIISSLVSKSSIPSKSWVALFIIGVVFLLSRLSILTKVGIGLLTPIMFGITLVFGPALNMLLILVSTAAYIKIASKPTSFDFLITKNVNNAIAQAIYLGLWTGAMALIFRWWTLDYVMANLMFTYMIAVVVYVIFMVICLPILVRDPIPQVFINAMMMFVIQYFLWKFAGLWFMNFMIGLAPV